MKKKLFAAFLLGLSLSVVAACNGEEETDVDGTSIQFFNSEGWSEVYATAQNAEGEELLGEFPGTEATPVDGADDFYEVEVPVENVLNNPVTIVFNDGDSEEAEPSTVNHPDFLFVTMEEDGVYGSRSNARFSMREVEDTRVYFYNPHEWQNMNVYSWTDDGELFGGWPGSGEAVQEDDRDGWYYVDVPEEVDENEIGFIINGEDADGEDVQTEDILINDSSLVYVHPEIPDEEYGFDSYEAAEDDFDTLQAQTEVYFYNAAVDGTDFEGFDSVYVDVVDHDGNQVLDGEPVEDAEEYWYTAVIPFAFGDAGEDAYLEVTFHDGDGNEATTQTIEDEESVYVTYDALYDDQGEAERVSSGVTVVEFYNDADWDNVYANATTENGDLDFTDVAADEDEDGWYTVEVPLVVFEDDADASFDIYFHDGDGNESPTQTIESAATESFLSSDGVWSGRDVAETFIYAEADEFLTFHFYNYFEWDNVRAYIWSEAADQVLGDWPGMMMEHDEGDWYTLDIPIDLADEEVDIGALVFNGVLDGEDVQTDDITVDDESNLYFTATAGSYENREAAEAGVEEALAGTEVSFYNSENWDSVHATVDDERLDETFEVEADEDGEGWFSVNVPLVYETDFDDSFDITFHDGNGESRVATITGEEFLYVTMDDIYRDQTWASTLQDSEDKTTIYFHNSEEWDEVNVHMWGAEGFGGWPGAHLDEGEGNWYSVDVPLNPDEDLEGDESYGIIFNEQLSEDSEQTADYYFESLDNPYFVLTGEMDDGNYVVESYATQDDAEAALE